MTSAVRSAVTPAVPGAGEGSDKPAVSPALIRICLTCKAGGLLTEEEKLALEEGRGSDGFCAPHRLAELSRVRAYWGRA